MLHRLGHACRRAAPDVILLDLNLPKKDGRQVLAEGSRPIPELHRIPVVILTTSKAEEDVLQKLRPECQLLHRQAGRLGSVHSGRADDRKLLAHDRGPATPHAPKLGSRRYGKSLSVGAGFLVISSAAEAILACHPPWHPSSRRAMIRMPFQQPGSGNVPSSDTRRRAGDSGRSRRSPCSTSTNIGSADRL